MCGFVPCWMLGFKELPSRWLPQPAPLTLSNWIFEAFLHLFGERWWLAGKIFERGALSPRVFIVLASPRR